MGTMEQLWHTVRLVPVRHTLFRTSFPQAAASPQWEVCNPNPMISLMTDSVYLNGDFF